MNNQKLFSDFNKRRDAIKEYARNKNIALWKIAGHMGINDGNLSRKLRTDPEEQNQDIYSRVDRLAAGVGE